MKKFKASLAAILAACSLLGLAGCTENREQTPNENSQTSDLSSSSSSESSQSSSSSSSSSSESSQSSSSSSSSSSESSQSSSSRSSSSSESSQSSSSSSSSSSESSQSSSSSSSSSSESSQSSSSSSSSSSESINTKPVKQEDKNTVNSVKLFDKISADMDNAMFSPLSLNLALGLVEVGAAGNTKAQIDDYLQTANIADFAKSYMERAKTHLTREGDMSHSEKYPKSTVEIANSFWASDTVPFNDDYKKILADKFEAKLENVDFTDKPGTLEKVNGWVNEKTYGMIPTILEEDHITENTAAVLINTVYFESAWDFCPWDIDESKKESFTLSDGTVKELPLMYSYGDLYYENDSATAFGRRYLNGLSFIGILPKEEGEFTLESLDIPSLLKTGSDDYTQISAVMPRLNFESEFPLNEPLAEAGMAEMFDKEKANFPGMSSEPLYIGTVLQKTKLELDENGTKAAAATMINPATGGADIKTPRKAEVRLDRPFAFLIYDAAQKQILFMGKVTTVES